MSYPHTFHLAPTSCPACGTQLDAAASQLDQGPQPGDMTVCIRCGELLTYTERLRLHRAIAADLQGMTDDQLDEVRRIQAAVSLFRRTDRPN